MVSLDNITPLWSAAIALNCWLSPEVTVADVGLIVIVARTSTAVILTQY